MLRQEFNSIYLSGDITGNDDAREFIGALESVDGDVTVYINSGGGDVFAAKEMANACKRKKARCVVNGLCASSATYILMASETPVVYNDSVIMIHKPSCASYGTSYDHKKTIEALDTIEDSMVETYMSRYKGSEESLRRMIDRESWFTGREVAALFDVTLDGGDFEFANDLDKAIYDKGAEKFINSVSVSLDLENKEIADALRVYENDVKKEMNSTVFRNQTLKGVINK